MKRVFFVAFIPLLILAACAAQPTPPTKATANPRVFGTLEVTFDSTTRTATVTRGARTQGVLPDSAISFTPDTFTNLVDATNNVRYLSADFNISNVSGADINNLTLYAYAQGANSVGGTAIKNIVNFGGFTLPSAAAQQARPAHGTNGATVAVDPTRADMQVFQPTEVSAVQSAAFGAASSNAVLEYGYVARATRATAASRTIPSAGTGVVTIGIRLPSGTGAYKFSMTFALASEAATRVTRSPEESTVDAVARAGALLASEVVLVGTDLDAPGGVIRLANAKISTSPAFLLEPQCGLPAANQKSIMEVQGSGSSSLLTGTVTVDGVVTANFQNVTTPAQTNLSGFFIQDRYGDGNPATSDGLFVFSSTAVTVGSLVRVAGTVAEFPTGTGSATQISTVTAVTACGARVTSTGASALPNPVDVSLPLTNGQADLERYEGMRVRFPAALTVTELFQLGRYGQVTLASGGLSNQAGTDDRLDGYTNDNAPSASGLTAYLAEMAKRRIVLDDGRSSANGTNAQNPDPIRIARGGNPLSATNTLRGGDTITGLEGILSQGCSAPTCAGTETSAYRVQLPLDKTANFQAVNVRPSTPTKTAALRVSSFNVLNFFNTLDTISSSSAPPFTPPGQNAAGAACATIEVRGAESYTNVTNDPNGRNEFARQRIKIVKAIQSLDADVLGLTEIQNNGSDGSSAIVNLVAALNKDQPAAKQYAVIADPAQPEASGCDAIKVAFIYRPSLVTPVGAADAPVTVSGDTAVSSDSSVPGSLDTQTVTVSSGAAKTIANGFGLKAYDNFNRKPVTVLFKQLSNNALFTAVINHFKSKSSAASDPLDTDQGDGQGQSNATRVKASKDLKTWLATNPLGTTDADVLLFGDFNAYAKEDPLTNLESAATPSGSTTAFTNLNPTSSYSYVFDGFWGSLDHAFANSDLNTQVAGSGKYHINADEPGILDYNLNFKNDNQRTNLFGADQFRSSDHDAVYVDLNLTP